MSRRPVLWWLDPAGRPESRAWLERDLPQGYGLCEVSLEGDWEGPPRSRPVGIVVTATVVVWHTCGPAPVRGARAGLAT